MGVDYCIKKIIGFELPSNILSKDWIILENLYNKNILIKHYNHIDFIDSEIYVTHGRLTYYKTEKMGETIYPETYNKVITKDQYNKTYIINEDILSTLNKLSFKLDLKYYELAYIC